MQNALTYAATLITKAVIPTPLGEIIAHSDNKKLILVQFSNHKSLSSNEMIKYGETKPLIDLKIQIDDYFAGSLTKFTVPLDLSGTTFQKMVWQELLQINYGETKCYAEQAKAIGKAKATRAVANANGANRFVIIIPCHRIIQRNGLLGGYSAGIERKKWLLTHEARYKNTF